MAGSYQVWVTTLGIELRLRRRRSRRPKTQRHRLKCFLLELLQKFIKFFFNFSPFRNSSLHYAINILWPLYEGNIVRGSHYPTCKNENRSTAAYDKVCNLNEKTEEYQQLGFEVMDPQCESIQCLIVSIPSCLIGWRECTAATQALEKPPESPHTEIVLLWLHQTQTITYIIYYFIISVRISRFAHFPFSCAKRKRRLTQLSVTIWADVLRKYISLVGKRLVEISYLQDQNRQTNTGKWSFVYTLEYIIWFYWKLNKSFKSKEICNVVYSVWDSSYTK